MNYVEIHQQLKSLFREPLIRQKLSAMLWNDCLDGLDLDNKLIFYKEIDSIPDIGKLMASIDKGDWHLNLNPQPGLSNLKSKTSLV